MPTLLPAFLVFFSLIRLFNGFEFSRKVAQKFGFIGNFYSFRLVFSFDDFLKNLDYIFDMALGINPSWNSHPD